MDLNSFLVAFVTIVVVFGTILGTCAYLIFVERKVAAYMQDRIGPNRVGYRGLLQPIADGLKFLFKEDIIPDYADKVLFLAAPAIAVSTSLLAFAVVPFGATSLEPGPSENFQFVIAPRVDIGILFVFAVTSLAVYAIILGGWASNNKYSFLGGLRSSAQFISYEIPMGMSVLGVVMLAGSLNLERIIAGQIQHGWNILYQPLAFLLFLTSAFAECNRLPFDLPEAEQELVGGYHTEFSALKFGLFFLGEYTHMITTSFLCVILFFGGWHLPWITADGSGIAVVKLAIFVGKATLVILFFMLVRWTLPRFRFDQLMQLAWKVLIPLALANLVLVMVVKEMGSKWFWLLFPLSIVVLVAAAALALLNQAGRHVGGRVKT
jgi:NADH-quinone oxidoreductase subunit H